MAVTFRQKPAAPAVPAGAYVATNQSQLTTRIAARKADGASEDIHIQFDPTPVMFDGVKITDGGTGLRFYGNGAPNARWYYNSQAGTAGGTCCRLKDSENIEFYNIDFDGEGDATWIWVVGGSYAGDGSKGDCKNIVLSHCEVRDAWQNPVVVSGNHSVTGVGTSDVTIQWNDIHGSGQGTGEYGEGVYIGQGTGGDNLLYRIHIIGNDIHNIRGGESIEYKNDIRDTSYCTDNDVWDGTISSGGAITIDGEGVVLARNRLWNQRAATIAFVTEADGIFLHGVGTIVEHNIIWDVDGRLITVATSADPIDSELIIRHNLMDARTGIAALGVHFSTWPGPNRRKLVCDNNIYLGTYQQVGPQGTGVSTFNDVSATTTDFEGPFTGNADNGTGPGSGWEPKLAATQIIDVASTIPAVTKDVQFWDLPASGRDFGPFDHDATDPGGGPPSTLFETLSPVDGATAVTTPITINGTASPFASDYQYEVYDVTNTTVLDAFGAGSVTYTPATETWAADGTEVIPQAGETIRIRARRW